jgi:pyruvate kinase
MLNKTKVVATIGPSTMEKEQLKKLMLNGMDVARLNMSHANYNFCKDIIEKIDELNEELKLCVAIMIDLVGPEVRTGRFLNGQAYFRKGDKIRIYMDEVLGDSTKFSVNYSNLIKEVQYNSILKIKDGMMLFEVVDIKTDCLICDVLTDGILDDCQTVAVEGVKLNLPFLTSKDETDILFASKMNVDFLAISYVSSQEEVLAVNDILIGLKNDHIGIISKIENEDGIANLDEIIRVSDGIMVARGDLGVDIPLERVPGVQKKIVNKCHEAGIVSIVATEMLSSMETATRPTRAEVSDVANAVLDGADAVMLSGETTIGKFPIETLNMMEKIINSAEKDIDYIDFIHKLNDKDSDITGMLADNVATTASKLKCCAIIAPTMSGYTARKMSRYRPSCPIIAVSPSLETVKSLQLNFGVNPVLIDELKSLEKIIEVAKKITFKLISTKPGDKIIITGGYPFSEVKSTNFMKIEEL